jgi:hypothetical protein
MANPIPSSPVERLFPFVLRSRALLVGREILRRNKRKLHFVLVTTDISDNGRAEILSDFAYYPIVQRYTSEELMAFFGIRGAKVIGFQKSGLAQSIYAELKPYRINRPATPPPKREINPVGSARAPAPNNRRGKQAVRPRRGPTSNPGSSDKPRSS